MKYKFFNIKIITANLFVIFFIIFIFIWLVSVGIFSVFLFEYSMLALAAVFGFLLVSFVVREAKNKEKISFLAEELAKSNEELKRLDEAKSEFISIASHQLRSPLTAVKGYISILLEATL